MIDRGYPEEDLDKMREGMSQEGWMEDPLLPPRWCCQDQAFHQKTKCHGFDHDILLIYSPQVENEGARPDERQREDLC